MTRERALTLTLIAVAEWPKLVGNVLDLPKGENIDIRNEIESAKALVPLKALEHAVRSSAAHSALPASTLAITAIGCHGVYREGASYALC